MAEDHQAMLTISDTHCDLCPEQNDHLSGFIKEDKSTLGKSLKHCKNVLRTLLYTVRINSLSNLPTVLKDLSLPCCLNLVLLQFTYVVYLKGV